MSAASASFSATDHAMMARALRLAERGAYTTRPNPMVGCVIARKDKVVGEGYHVRAGEPHAEVFALRQAGDKARGATCLRHPRALRAHRPHAALRRRAGRGRHHPRGRRQLPIPTRGGRRRLPQADGRRVESEKGLLHAQARDSTAASSRASSAAGPWLRVKLAASLDGRNRARRRLNRNGSARRPRAPTCSCGRRAAARCFTGKRAPRWPTTAC
jgi:diaminohydroxyphosphoribosylaminopyrimidine deaminase/5-amino-6-(5-phosphoribosylamino)uracil reductase